MQGSSKPPQGQGVKAPVEHDEGKIDEMVLALLYLTTFKDGPSMRAWKRQDWAAMERLYKG